MQRGIRAILRSSVRHFSKKRDYYEVLGLQKNADAAEIKKAYVRLARDLHPDRNPAPNAKEKFTEVTEAYQTLSDDKKRAVYDSYGIGADEQKQYESSGFGGAQDFGNFSDFFGGGGRAGFDNIFRDFEDFFGGEARKPQRAAKGADVVIALELDFMEAVAGTTKEVTFRMTDVCSTCNGSKCKPGTSPTKCSSCAGKGEVNFRQGMMFIKMPCNHCSGKGTTIKSPCTTCRGSGQSNKTVKETVNVPKGVSSGQSLRLTGKGNIGESGGTKGDLLIKVTVRPDKYFRREEYNIITDLNISVAQAALGIDVDVKTVSGNRRVKVPPGTNHGNKIRLQGEGISKLPPNEHQKGDHYVLIHVTVPARLSPEQKALYEQLLRLEESTSEKKSWF